MARNKFELKTKHRKYVYGCQIIQLEKKCFGWRTAGKSSTTVDDGYESTISDEGSHYKVTTRHKSHVVKYAYFKRPRMYAKNPLFSIVEMLSGIVSFLRVLALNLIAFAILASVVLMIADPATATPVVSAIAIVYAALIGASLLLAGAGYGLRKAFKLDEKTDEILEANGYIKWSEYRNDNSTSYYNA